MHSTPHYPTWNDASGVPHPLGNQRPTIAHQVASLLPAAIHTQHPKLTCRITHAHCTARRARLLAVHRQLCALVGHPRFHRPTHVVGGVAGTRDLGKCRFTAVGERPSVGEVDGGPVVDGAVEGVVGQECGNVAIQVVVGDVENHLPWHQACCGVDRA